MGLAVDGNRTGSDDLTATRRRLVRDPTRVHDLRDDQSAVGMHRVGDVAPTLDLLVRDQTGLTGEALACMARVGALADDQAEGRALLVVLDHQWARHAVLTGPNPRERGHHQTVVELQVTELQRGKQLHGSLSSRVRAQSLPLSTPNPKDPPSYSASRYCSRRKQQWCG